MRLHRALLCSIAAALLFGLVGCEAMWPPPSSVYPSSKSSSNMKNTMWSVTGEETPQVPMPEAGPPPQAPGTPAPAKSAT